MKTIKAKFAAIIDGSTDTQIIFKPALGFYQAVGIGRKLFGQLFRGEKSPLLEELERLAHHFGQSVNDFI